MLEPTAETEPNNQSEATKDSSGSLEDRDHTFSIPALIGLLVFSFIIEIPSLRLFLKFLGDENLIRYWSLIPIARHLVLLGVALCWHPKILSLSRFRLAWETAAWLAAGFVANALPIPPAVPAMQL